MNQPKRQSNIEILRIIAISMIIIFHYTLHGGWQFDTGTTDQIIVKIFLVLGELGVNLFMLITGYFMIERKRKCTHILQIILESVFYTALTSIILYKNNLYDFKTPDAWLKIIFPELYNIYWYVTVYILIYILSPYINKMLHTLDKKQMREFLATVLCIWCVVPSIFQNLFGTTETGFYYSRFIWLIIVYCIGAYIKMYGPEKINTLKKNMIFAAIVFGMMLVLIIVSQKNPHLFAGIVDQKFWAPNTILMILLSIALFNCFCFVSVKFIPLVNTVAGTTLGVYMFHAGLLYRFIWEKIEAHIHIRGGGLTSILIGSLLVLLTAVIIDLLRKILFEIITKLIKKIICKEN